MRRIIACLMLAFFCNLAYAQTYSGGSGTIKDPYQIATTTDLYTLDNTSADWNKCFILTADIDMKEQTGKWYSIGNHVNPFTGSFDGNWRTIKNLVISDDYYLLEGTDRIFCYNGVFGYLGQNSVVKNLAVVNATISDYDWSQSLSSKSMWPDMAVGGLVGYNYGSVTNVYFSNSKASTWARECGGFCHKNNGTISKCHANIEITGNYAAGFCLINLGTISDCYAIGSVYGTQNASGFCLSSVKSDSTTTAPSIKHCYSTCYVSGTDQVSGFCQTGEVTDCYFYKYGGPDNGIGIALDDEQLQDKTNFVSFDFKNSAIDGTPVIWEIKSGYMPRLTWQSSPGYEAPYRIKNIETTLSGAGYADDPFIIANLDDMLEFKTNTQLRVGYYLLAGDLDLSGEIYENSFIPESFQGTFDGDGHTISGLTITSEDDALGIFILLNGEIRDLCLDEILVESNYRYATTGGFCARNAGKISGCCLTDSIISAPDEIGGLCGNNRGVISDCYVRDSIITAVYPDSSCTAGGLCAINEGTITRCYTNCRVYSSVSGALCGQQTGEDATLTNSFWDTQTSGLKTGYTLGDQALSTAITNVQGITRSEMQDSTKFKAAGWDFTLSDGDKADWRYVDGWYPFLVWQTGTPLLKLTTSSMHHHAVGDSGSFPVTSNVNWTAESKSSWISITNGSSGMNSGEISYTITANSSGIIRTGYIDIFGGGGSKKFAIVQHGGPSLKSAVFKAGRIRNKLDNFSISGSLSFLASDMSENQLVTVRFLQPESDTLLFEDTFASGFNPAKPNSFIYKNVNIANGKLNYFKCDFTRGIFSMVATGQDLTNWETPLLLEVQIGGSTDRIIIYGPQDEILDDVEADNTFVLSSKTALPWQYLIGQKDHLRILKNSVKTNAKSGVTAGTVSGQITTTTVSGDVTQVVISWKNFSKTLNLTRKGNTNYYFFKKAKTENSVITAASFNLDKCVFTVTIKGYKLGTAENFDLHLQ